jgi:hypothetical protein
MQSLLPRGCWVKRRPWVRISLAVFCLLFFLPGNVWLWLWLSGVVWGLGAGRVKDDGVVGCIGLFGRLVHAGIYHIAEL